MRKIIVTVMASLLSCSVASAFWPEATDSSLEIGVGYRVDSLKWKTKSRFDDSSSSYYSDSSEGPFRLESDLEWKNLNIWQIEGRGRYITCDNIYLRGSADYGWITSGKNTDKDKVGFNSYGSDFEFAHSHSKAKGHVYDVKVAVGYQFKLCDDSFAITPLIGYSWQGIHLKDRHLRQTFASFDDGSSSNYTRAKELNAKQGSYYSDYYYDYYSDYFSSYSDDYTFSPSYSSDYSSYSTSYGGDHSRYNARWNGFFIGFDFDYSFCCEWDLFGSYEFHWADYHAKAHWDLRPDLCNGFNHHVKNFYGQVFDIGVKWDFCECWTLALRGEFQWFWGDHGHDRAKVAHNDFGDVKTDCYLKIPLKDIRWDSAAVTLDIGMVF